MPLSSQPTVVDLFCGAGGLSLGLRVAGLSPIYAIDKFEAAVQTYRENIGAHVRSDEINIETCIPAADIIVGGPPCQGFSSAGLRRAGDARNSLVSVYAQIVAEHRPKVFVFENVEGFLTSEGGIRVLDLLEPLIDAGYRIHLRKINAANYGVPQHRKRVIAIGALGCDPHFPEATHRAFGAPGAALGAIQSLPWAPTLGDAIESLPTVAKSKDGQNGTLPNISDHTYRQLSEEDLQRAQRLQPGQRMRDLPEEFWHESYRRRAYRRVKDGTPTERRGGAPAGLRRLHADHPSKAITSGAVSEFIHPTENRGLTLRECARIQTFPDSFRFFGTAAERALLIGNAVPPQLAIALGTSLALLFREDSIGSTNQSGALLSFVPTLSEGMSPALAATTKLVHGRFCGAAARKQMSLWR